MTTEDELRHGLRQQFGDPDAPLISPDEPAPADRARSTIEARAATRDDRRRAALWLGTAAAVLVVLFVGVGHLVGGGRSTVASSGTVPATVAPTSSSTGAPSSAIAGGTTLAPTSTPSLASTTVAPVTTLGPSSTAAPTTSPPTTTPPAGVVDCGTAYLASGWPTTVLPSPTLQQCILSAFAAGTPATYAERAQTDGVGGHIEVTTYLVTGVRQVRRTVDATGAQPPGGDTVSVCTGLAPGNDGQLAATGCSSA